jgi:nucleotide-binding universal stress UspA family protein
MKILIPLDGSKFAEQILEPAIKLAESSNAEVQLLEVVGDGHSGSLWRRGPTTDEPHNIGSGMAMGVSSPVPGGTPAETAIQAEERLKQQAEDYLNHLATTRFPRGAKHVVVFGENPAEEIAKYAREEGVDLIALATHGHSGLSRLLMGSVADHLLKSRVAPLMMVHPDGLN